MRALHPRALLLAAITLLSAGASGLDGDQGAYLLETRILKVPSSQPWRQLTVNADRAVVIGAPQPALQLGGAAKIHFGDLIMSLDGDVITWNGKPEPPAEAGVEVLAAPQLAVLNGQSAELQISSGPLEYFEPKEDGSFALRRTSETQQPGVSLAATVYSDKVSSSVTLDFQLRVVRCTRRLPLPGVSLDVGPPVITLRETRTSVVLSPGEWCLLGAHASASPSGQKGAEGEGEHRLLVLVRVTPAAPPR